jgi:predicted ATPase/class 3 adenylate cyclase
VETFTFLFTDIEASTVLLRRLGDARYARVLTEHHALVRSGLAAHDGEEVDTQGDAFFAIFASPRASVAAAADLQRALQAHHWPDGEQIRVRMGIHTGEASRIGAGLVGLDVHRAARIAAVGYGGQILLSDTTAALVRGSLPPGLALRDLDEHQLKDLGRPERIFQLDVAGLPDDFPPLRSLGHPSLPNNLPAQLATFVGREREREEIRTLTRSARLVTLTGAGGSGKTRLALQVAAELLDGSGDGVWLVELAGIGDAAEVPAAISAALGIASRPGRPVLDHLLDALALQDVLIVLDNCEHLIEACAKTADAIVRRCPRVHLLTTSREPLGIGGEAIYRVPSLSLPNSDQVGPGSGDAVALFVARAREQRLDLPLDDETGPLLASICRRLDGLPLAIELAAARLRSLSLRDLHDRLDQRFRLLTGGSRTALARQQTLRATVEWSYSLLTGAEQGLLGLLSVFADSFDLAAVEGVCGTGGIEVFDLAGLLGSLVDKSLVLVENAGGTLRYRLLETIREYAAERLVEAGDQTAGAARADHSAYFLTVAQAAAPHLTGAEQGRWFARLDADDANLRRAADYAASVPDGTAQVLRFAVALRRYWMARSREPEALKLILPVLERPEARADRPLFGAALVAASQVSGSFDLTQTRRLAEQAVELARELPDDRLLIEGLEMLAASGFLFGEAGRGLRLIQEAVERARALGDDVLLGKSLVIYRLFGDLLGPGQADRLYAEALACTERSGDLLARYALLNNTGADVLLAGDLPAARARLEHAAQAAEALGVYGPHVENLGWVRRAEGDLDGAQAMFEMSLRMSRRSGQQFSMACALLGLACLAADRTQGDRAAGLHGLAQGFCDRSGRPWEELTARYQQASQAMLRNQLGQERFDRAYAAGLALPADQALRSEFLSPAG